jgi:hypothetical protein
VESIGYDPEAQAMEVKYHSGHIYRYEQVPATEHARLLTAPSIGKHLNSNFRGVYASTKVAEP